MRKTKNKRMVKGMKRKVKQYNNRYYNSDIRQGRIQTKRGAWVAQSVECPALAEVMISQFVRLSPASGSGLMAQSLEPVSDSVSPSLSAPPPFMLCLSLSQK